MCIFFPNVDGPKLHILIHTAQHLFPISLCLLISLGVEAECVEYFGFIFHIDLVQEIICASYIDVMLATPLEEEQVVIEGFPEIPLPHLHGHTVQLSLLHFFCLADAFPFAHGNTKLSIVKFPDNFVCEPSLGCPYELLIETKLLLLFHREVLHLFVHLHSLIVFGVVLLILLIKRIGLPVVEVGAQAVFEKLPQFYFNFVPHYDPVLTRFLEPFLVVGV